MRAHGGGAQRGHRVPPTPGHVPVRDVRALHMRPAGPAGSSLYARARGVGFQQQSERMGSPTLQTLDDPILPLPSGLLSQRSSTHSRCGRGNGGAGAADGVLDADAVPFVSCGQRAAGGVSAGGCCGRRYARHAGGASPSHRLNKVAIALHVLHALCEPPCCTARSTSKHLGVMDTPRASRVCCVSPEVCVPLGGRA